MNVGKQYRIGSPQSSYVTLRETLTALASAPFRRLARKSSSGQETFWALQGVNFEVNSGEVVGIIGRNGAGKSTLLKLLSRITEPTTGRIELYGRIGSLLEVGTGFHAELSGRENIYLNGAILGMVRTEISRKFDEIVAFAEVERFIDTPVKHFSSGMYLRLAFAVAAHLEPEILLVDEVLAVGDGRFQRKCLDKMQEVGQQGRTVLFVSHNMPAITRLCPRTILLDAGRVIGDGQSSQVVGAYLSSGLGTTAVRVWSDLNTAPGDDIVRLCAVRVCTEDRVFSDAFDIRKPIGIEMEYEVFESGHVLTPNFHCYNEEGVYAFVAVETDSAWAGRARSVGRYVSTAWIPGNLLSEGTLFVGAAISTMDPVVVHFYERDAVAFQIIDTMDGDSARGEYAGPMPGVMRPLLQWSTRMISKSDQPVTAQAGEGAR
jgi:lipopolysaccharide transport system ATP-binding protein